VFLWLTLVSMRLLRGALVDPKAGTAEIVMMTHPAREAAVQGALGELSRLDVVKEIGPWVRVEA